MYFDESGYFLDCSTGFISRSKKAAKKEDLVSILFSLSEANICWPIISEMRVNTKQVVTQTGIRTLPRSRRGVFRVRSHLRTEEVSKGHRGRNSDVYAYVDVRRWRLFVLARERKCEAFTSRQRTSSPGKLQRYQFNLDSRAQKRWQGDLIFLGKVLWLLFANLI